MSKYLTEEGKAHIVAAAIASTSPSLVGELNWPVIWDAVDTAIERDLVYCTQEATSLLRESDKARLAELCNMAERLNRQAKSPQGFWGNEQSDTEKPASSEKLKNSLPSSETLVMQERIKQTHKPIS